ncbi:HAD hydrolase [Phellopilus nigrolimitatus]|nr:HAD hydrolase [Phellopilus nigrolimitatus]
MSFALHGTLRLGHRGFRTTIGGIFHHPRRLESHLAGLTLQETLQRKPPLAFAFDIDGVLLHGEEVIPQAKKALRMLNGENELGIKIPYIMITNGGGVSETVRCQKLTEKLGVEISLSQFMQAHTVLKSIVDQYAEKPVLVLGGLPGSVPQVAEEYGFRNVYTTLDIMAWNPSIWPMHDLDANERAFVESRPPFEPSTRFAAIFVFHDPRNWALDIQVTCDILLNGGSVLPALAGPTASTLVPENEGAVKLVFCNPDLLWRSDFPVPRLGQGGFRIAFEAVYHSLTGKNYPCVQYGKPTRETYAYAEQVLRGRLHELLLREGMVSKNEHSDYTPNVYMIGDNPESDIAGANAKGWSSVLVNTGVYDPKCGPPAHEPSHIAQDVEQAVRWAIDREFARLR